MNVYPTLQDLLDVSAQQFSSTSHRIDLHHGFEDTLQQALLRKEVVDAMRTWGRTSTSIAAARALQVQSMGSSHVALVSLLLRESALVDYKARDPFPWERMSTHFARPSKWVGPVILIKCHAG